MPEQVGQGRSCSCVVGPCKGLCKDGRQSSQEVGGPGVCAVGEQKVGTLQVRDCGDAVFAVVRARSGRRGLGDLVRWEGEFGHLPRPVRLALLAGGCEC